MGQAWTRPGARSVPRLCQGCAMLGVGRVSGLGQEERFGCSQAVLELCYRQCEQGQWPGHGTRANVHLAKGN